MPTKTVDREQRESEEESILVDEEDAVVQHVESISERGERWAEKWDTMHAGKIIDMEVVDDPDPELLIRAGVGDDIHQCAGERGERIADEIEKLEQDISDEIDAEDWNVSEAVVAITVELPGGDTFTDAFHFPRTGKKGEIFDLLNALERVPEMDESPVGEIVPVKQRNSDWRVVVPDNPPYVQDAEESDSESRDQSLLDEHWDDLLVIGLISTMVLGVFGFPEVMIPIVAGGLWVAVLSDMVSSED